MWRVLAFSSTQLYYCIFLFGVSDLSVSFKSHLYISGFMPSFLFNLSWSHSPSCPLSMSIHQYNPSWETLSPSRCPHAVSHPTFLIFPYRPAATDTPCRSIKGACSHTLTHPPYLCLTHTKTLIKVHKRGVKICTKQYHCVWLYVNHMHSHFCTLSKLLCSMFVGSMSNAGALVWGWVSTGCYFKDEEGR